jgi:alpha-L-rhamnosidase
MVSFKFQINDNVTFKRNNKFLSIARECKPELYYRQYFSKGFKKFDKKTGKLVKYDELESKEFGKDGYFILDFENHFVGHFSIDINRIGSMMDAPLTLKIQFAETVEELNHDSSEYSGWLSSSWISEEIIHIDELPYELKLPRRYSFRYVKVTVVDTSPKWKVYFKNPRVVSESAVDENNMPSTNTDDEELKKISDISVKTLAECMQDVFEDGPKRDQRLWLGDLHLQALVNYETFKNYDLVKRCLYLFAGMTSSDGKLSANIFTHNQLNADDTFLFDYSLFFVSSLRDYFVNSKDIETVRDLYPIAKKQIELAANYVSKNGKLSLPEDWPVFVDWGNELDRSTAAQGIFIRVLKDFQELDRMLKIETERKYIKLLDNMISYSRDYLYKKGQKLFISGPKSEINIYSQVWMILADVLPSTENLNVMKQTYKNMFPIKNISTPYMYHFVVEALLSVGMKEEAISLIKDYWGSMIEKGADTFWEAYKPDDPSYSPYGSPLVNSYCHAWSCTPVYLIKKYNL